MDALGDSKIRERSLNTAKKKKKEDKIEAIKKFNNEFSHMPRFKFCVVLTHLNVCVLGQISHFSDIHI